MKKFQYFLICSIFVLLSEFAFAIDEYSDKAVSPHFIINATQDTKVDFILAKQKIDAVIIGSIADVTVEQHYINRGKGAIEGVYVFPASTRAAVYGMNMQIGKRLIIAQIKKKNDARQEYETAKKEGKRAALLEQFEDNVFKMNVANIMQGDTVITIMKYTENLDASNGIYEFVYPTVVAPRYVSPTNIGKNDDEYGEIPYIDTKLIPDFNFEMNVVLNSGLNIDTIYSKSHKFDFNYSEINGIRYKADAKLNDSEFSANRDIILNFSFANQIYQTGLLVNEKDKYFMLTLQPPKRIEPISIINREYIFVMDVSGSMEGFPIDISKNIMKRIISGLDEDDLFNIVFFAGGSEMLFCLSQKADKMNKKFAEIFIENQKGGGRTELLPALQKVMNIPKVKGYSRIIPILTDGEISISSETFNLIRNNIGDANIFSFGIGSSVNRDIIEGMARAGFGEKFIATNSEDGMKQGELMLNMIDSPIMTDIKAEFNGWKVQDVTPSKIPDLFLNKPITIYGKYEGNLGGEIKISGQYGAERISVTMPLHKFAMSDSSNSIRYLAVRNKIAELNDLYNHDYNYKSSNKETLEKTITDLCLQNNLLSKFTSFIAVDYEIVNKGGISEKVNQINAVPKGMNKEFQNVDVISRASSVGGDGVDLGGFSANIELSGFSANDPLMPSYGGKGNSNKNSESSSHKIYDEPEPDEFVLVELEPGVDLEKLQKLVIYPLIAYVADIEGRVIVRVLVNKSGKVLKRFIESSDHELLNKAALDAIDKYGYFTPAVQNGKKITCWVSIPVTFKINEVANYSSKFSKEVIEILRNNSKSYRYGSFKIYLDSGDTVKFNISIFDNDCNYYVNNKDMTYIIDTSDPDGYFPFLFAGKGPGSVYEVEVPAKDFLYKFPELELAKGKMVKVRVMIEE